MREEGCMEFIPSENLEEKRQEFKAERAFVAAFKRGDIKGCVSAFKVLRHKTKGGLQRALQTHVGIQSPSDDFRRQMLEFYGKFGGSLRDALQNDIIFFDFLRAVLPPY